MLAVQPDLVTREVSDHTDKRFLVWCFVVRVYGLRLAEPAWLFDAAKASIKFLPAGRRLLTIFLTPEFKAKCPYTLELLQTAVGSPRCCWRLLKYRPDKVTKTVFVISCLKERDVVEGTVSFIGFLRLITLVDVRNSSDGIRRRGVQAKC